MCHCGLSQAFENKHSAEQTRTNKGTGNMFAENKHTNKGTGNKGKQGDRTEQTRGQVTCLPKTNTSNKGTGNMFAENKQANKGTQTRYLSPCLTCPLV